MLTTPTRHLLAAVLACLVAGCSDGPPAGSSRLFVTSAEFSPNLGGLRGADELCTNFAEGAGLGGQWVAWLSSHDTDAIDRVTSSGPWYLLDGTKAFENHANLKTTPLAPINVDERGNPSTDLDDAWTGTQLGGVKDCEDPSCQCSDWTAESSSGVSTGLLGATDQEWTAVNAQQYCTNGGFHLYCFEN